MNRQAKLRSVFRLLPLLLPIWVSACATHGLSTDALASENATSQNASNGRLVAQARTSAVNRSQSSDTSVNPSVPAVKLTPDLLFQLLAAEITAQRGQLGSAAETYLNLARETRDPRLARRATDFATAQRALARALKAAQLWVELDPGSTLAEARLESLWLANGHLAEAEPLVNKRLSRAREAGNLPAYYRNLGRALSRSANKSDAFAMLERVAQKDLDVAEARLALAAAAKSAKKFGRAVTEAQAASKLTPDNEQIAILSASQADKGPDGLAPSLAILNRYLTRQPKSLQARYAYARLLSRDNRQAESKEQFELALDQDPDNPGVLYSLAQLAYQTDQKKVARVYLERYVALPSKVQRDNNPAQLFLGQLNEEFKEFKRAIRHYSAITVGAEFLDARIRSAILKAKLGDIKAGRKILRTTTVGSAAQRGRLTSAEAEILRTAKRDPEAFDLLNKAVKQQGSNTDLLYDHAMAAERINRIKVMEKSLRQVIRLRPDGAHAYNALGYTLADRNLRLPEAQKLIEKALDLVPGDAHILDSLGWVRFRRGDLNQAEQYLREAFEKSPEAEIAAHLGEVLWKKGQAADAKAMFSKALDLDPDNQTLKRTMVRLRVDL